MKDENQPFKPGGRRSRGAGGVGDLVGRETFSGCYHLSTDGGVHLSANTAPVGAGRPKCTGRSSLSSLPQEREWDRPRTRVPPSRRMTCCETPRCGWPPTPGQRTECCTLAGQQQFASPGMAGRRLLRRVGGWFPPPEAGGRSRTPAHAKVGLRLSSPSAPARMTKLLEAEGGAEATARLACFHQIAQTSG
jgi:hypothetical protein